MSAIAPLEDVDLTVLEELDFAATCTVRIAWVNALRQEAPIKTTCEEPAVALFKCRACAAEGLCCANHREYIASEKSITCGHCRATASGMSLYEFKPLGGVS